MVKLGTGSWEQGVGSWELDRDRERELGWDLGAEGTKSSEIPAEEAQIRILDPNGGFISNMVVFQKDFDEKWPLSKPENVAFARADQAIQSQLSLQVYHQKCNLREP